MMFKSVFALIPCILVLLAAAYVDESELRRSLAPRVQFSQYPFAAVILATGSDNSIEYVCSGSILNTDENTPSHILSTAFCIQDRQDAAGQPVTYTVLVEDRSGNITLGSTTFSQFNVDKRFQHPNSSQIRDFAFTSAFPNGTSADFTVAVAPYDIGVVRLQTSLSKIQNAHPAQLSNTVPKAGDSVSFVGYGGPQFFTLGATGGTKVLQSYEIQGSQQVPNGKLVILNDVRTGILPNETQAVEPGDEGSAIVDTANKLVGIVVGSWQVNPNSTDVVTFATLGPAMAPNVDFINSIVHQQTVQPSNSVGSLFPQFVTLALLGVSFFF